MSTNKKSTSVDIYEDLSLFLKLIKYQIIHSKSKLLNQQEILQQSIKSQMDGLIQKYKDTNFNHPSQYFLVISRTLSRIRQFIEIQLKKSYSQSFDHYTSYLQKMIQKTIIKTNHQITIGSIMDRIFYGGRGQHYSTQKKLKIGFSDTNFIGCNSSTKVVVNDTIKTFSSLYHPTEQALQKFKKTFNVLSCITDLQEDQFRCIFMMSRQDRSRRTNYLLQQMSERNRIIQQQINNYQNRFLRFANKKTNKKYNSLSIQDSKGTPRVMYQIPSQNKPKGSINANFYTINSKTKHHFSFSEQSKANKIINKKSFDGKVNPLTQTTTEFCLKKEELEEYARQRNIMSEKVNKVLTIGKVVFMKNCLALRPSSEQQSSLRKKFNRKGKQMSNKFRNSNIKPPTLVSQSKFNSGGS